MITFSKTAATRAVASGLVMMIPAMPVAAQEEVEQEEVQAIPAWFLEDIAFMTREGGRWIADNSDPDSPYQQWGMEWRVTDGGVSMTGHLFGFQDGEQSEDFFQFRQFWHPGEQRAIVMQWGADGWFATGELRRVADWNLLDQTFWVPGGRSFTIGHIARNPSEDEHITEQYSIPAGQGTWSLSSSNVWRRDRAGG